MKKTGAYEWGGTCVTIADGCGNGGCRYCYAREMAVRYHRNTSENWPNVHIRINEVNKERHKYKLQPVFFQSASDITPANLDACRIVLFKLLEAGNDVLIVTKPHWECIATICDKFKKYKKQMEFRFTIGSSNDDVLRFWDRCSPGLQERLMCLKYTFKAGYKTSVSCEPYLDPYPQYVYEACKDEITESFWIGLLRNWNRRVDLTGASTVEIQKYVDPLKKAQQPEFVRALVKLLDRKPLIKWKDSIRETI